MMHFDVLGGGMILKNAKHQTKLLFNLIHFFIQATSGYVRTRGLESLRPVTQHEGGLFLRR